MRETLVADTALDDGERHVIRFDGCRPAPLGSYLKALGILRLVSEQADANARGWWKDETFMLQVGLNMADLRGFFLERYRPTPLVGPWGARSGFFPGSPEKAARHALKRIEETQEPRLDDFSQVILQVREILSSLGFDKKVKGDKKLEVLRACRANLPDYVIPWLDACYVLTEGMSRYPPLLGTGGNEGSGSYFSGFAQMLIVCIIDRAYDEALSAALFDKPAPKVTSDQTPGQFDPGAAGGPNSSTGFGGDVQFNPWDYILCLEGTLLFSAAATRRHHAWPGAASSFPFTVQPTGSGSGQAALTDEVGARAEMWCPIWDRPATSEELHVLFGEGRVTLGRRAVRDGLEFCRAVAGLGVDRGIVAFERHGMLRRFGRNVLAIPLGRVDVKRNPSADLINDLDRGGWLTRFRRLARMGDPAASLLSIVRRLEDALFGLIHGRGPTAAAFQKVLLVLGEAQRYLAKSAEAMEVCPPVPLLSWEWAQAANDGSPEFRIAAALAGLHAKERDSGKQVLPLAVHVAPLAANRGRVRRWNSDAHHRVVWAPGGLHENLGRIMLRRLLECDSLDLDDFPLHGRATAPLSATSAWLAGDLADSRIAALLLGLSLARIPRGFKGSVPQTRPPPAGYALLKPLFTTRDQLWRTRVLAEGDSLPLPREVVRLLVADRPDDALRVASRTLRSRGLVSPEALIFAPGIGGDRLLSVVMAPLSDFDLGRLLRRLFILSESGDADTPQLSQEH